MSKSNRSQKRNVQESPGSSSSGSTVVDSRGEGQLDTLLRSSIRNGTYQCANRDHYKLEDGKLRMRHYRDVLEMMAPFKDAACWCERNACRMSWEFNYPGQSQLDFVAPKSYRKGYGKIVDGPKLVECVNYTLTPQQERYLERSYPNRVFCTTGDAYHDHPISHISAGISARRVWSKVPHGTEEKPFVYIDVDGNPTANEAVMRRNKGLLILTTCSAVAPKDFVRSATSWGPEKGEDGKQRYYPIHIRDFSRLQSEYGVDLVAVKGVVSFHSVYYYDRREISGVLQLCYNATFTCVLHRHKGDDGSLYDGEHEWVRDRVTNEIIQTNVHTGEKYVHPSTERWFTYTSCVVSQGHVAVVHKSGTESMVGGQALAWTTNMLNSDTFTLVIVSCPVIAAKSDLGGEYHAGMIVEYERPTVIMTTCEEVARQSFWTVGDLKVPVPVGCKEMLEVLYAIPRQADTVKVRKLYDMRCNLKKRDPPFTRKNRKGEDEQKLNPTEFNNLCEIAYWLNYSERYQQTAQARSANAAAIIESRSTDVSVRLGAAALNGVAALVRNGGLRGAAASMVESLGTELRDV